jgi:hypothetical protein
MVMLVLVALSLTVLQTKGPSWELAHALKNRTETWNREGRDLSKVKAEAEAASAVEAQGDVAPAVDPEDGVSMETDPEAESEERVLTSVQCLTISHIAPTLFIPNRFYPPYLYIACRDLLRGL